MEEWPEELFVEKADLYQLQLEERLQRAEEEADFLVKLFQTHGIPVGARILDLCCGIGRHSVALAKRGYCAVGVDFSQKFLERARELAEEAKVQERVEFVLQDVRKIARLPLRDFAAAICLYTSFGYYGEEEDRKLLESVRKMLQPGGIFVLDVAFREWLVRNFRPQQVSIRPGYLLVEEANFDLEESRTHSRWLFFLPKEGRGWVYAGEAKTSVRAYSLHELIRMFEETGWRYSGAYGGLDMSPFGLEARRLVVVAKNPG